MSKKVIILLGLGVALLAAGILFLVFDKNKEINELQSIIDGEDMKPPVKKEPVKKAKDITVINIDKPESNGTDRPAGTEPVATKI